MQIRATEITLVVLCVLFRIVHPQPAESLPDVILGGFGNVASTATNFFTGVVQRQKELLHRVTDTASNYINNAVEKPRNLLINATKATTGYIENAAAMGLEFKLRRFLEKFRSRMPQGIPELGIPPLEPLYLEKIVINIDNPEIGKVKLDVEDVLIDNLSTFVVKRAKLSLLGPTITVNLTVPVVNLKGFYNISGIVGDMFPLFGKGAFKAIVYDLKIYVNTMLGYSRGMYMKTFDLDFSLTSLSVQMENFMGGHEIGRVMNQVFEELAPQVVNLIKPDILPVIQDYIASRANETIHDLTMRDVLHVLVGSNDLLLLRK